MCYITFTPELVTSDQMMLRFKTCPVDIVVPPYSRTRALQNNMALSVVAESCLAIVSRFIAQCSYPNAIIINNVPNGVGAGCEINKITDEWNLKRSSIKDATFENAVQIKRLIQIFYEFLYVSILNLSIFFLCHICLSFLFFASF